MAALLAEGKPLPFDPVGQIIYYMAPTPAKPGQVIGSAGPTTAGRMDSYVDLFMQHGGSFVTRAKGNRAQAVTNFLARELVAAIPESPPTRPG